MVFGSLQTVLRCFPKETSEIIERFFAENDMTKVDFGKTFISPKIYLNKERYYGRDVGPYEGHKNHIDIHLLIKGVEDIEFSNDSPEIQEYDGRKDIYFCDTAESDCRIRLAPGFFVVFFEGELHKPCLKVDNHEIVKIVFKIEL
jgi:YhcH/YjgK/YiaL family protein